jgi:hypothetical protein
MCCCGQPVINGHYGYKWQPNDTPSIRQPYPPEIDEGDVLLYDGPGRCGGLDAHCHHYRVIRRFSSFYLLVQHGGGKEEIRLSTTGHFRDIFLTLDATSIYWLLHTLYYAHSDGKQQGAEQTRQYWQSAAIEKRIKTRKLRDRVKLWVEPRVIATSSAR